MEKLIDNKYLNLAIRTLLGGFLIYAAQGKILYAADFAQAIRAYDIIPVGLSPLPAIFLPWIELFCGVFLLFGFYTRSSALIAFSLMSLFSLNILIALLRGLDIDCGCGASIAGIERVSWLKILENAFLMVLFLKLNFTKQQFFAVDNIRVKA